ncbi:hypothetical protein [Phaeodactylibacter sp.]|uniref:hypothetical protein n=1 Tax=Phaeodactylibacter sp. TaxID=1940289 RepID=UPI0025FFBBD6|nr:hypothetical protein [Phaeodactylibacter sp.]MCI4650820.1 hypothetical protein [Phaeodactylibacter sp.]MCI5089777.1 hypothetical protein [Phaeodactylibacter sp.]
MSTVTYDIRTAREIMWLKKTWFQCHCTFELHTAEGFDFHKDELEKFEKEWRHQMDVWEEDPHYDLYDNLATKFQPFAKEIKAIQEHYAKLWGDTALSSSAKAATELGMSPQTAKEFVYLKMKVRHLEKTLIRFTET